MVSLQSTSIRANVSQILKRKGCDLGSLSNCICALEKFLAVRSQAHHSYQHAIDSASNVFPRWDRRGVISDPFSLSYSNCGANALRWSSQSEEELKHE